MAKKITVEVSEDLLRRAQEATGMGLTETVRRGLERVAVDRAHDERNAQVAAAIVRPVQ